MGDVEATWCLSHVIAIQEGHVRRNEQDVHTSFAYLHERESCHHQHAMAVFQRLDPLQSEFSLLFTIVTNHRPVVEVSLEPMVEFIATILKGSGSNIKASSQNEMRISSRTVKESSEVGP